MAGAGAATRTLAKAKSFGGHARVITAFDAGMSGRRLKMIPTNSAAINTLIRQYGAAVLARSRYLCLNNSHLAAAKEEFCSALVGTGIMPSPIFDEADFKKAAAELFEEWTDESDADGLTDFYGQQAIIAGELFEAGEVFIRIRPRRPEDGLVLPFQLQLLQSEMLPINKNENLDNGRTIECGIEFDGIGRRAAYHFFKKHPGEQNAIITSGIPTDTVAVPASEVLHLFRPLRAGQIRGIPHTLSALVRCAVLDAYEDAELERKRVAALFTAFITRPGLDGNPLGGETQQLDEAPLTGTVPANSVGLEPGATVDLDLGENVAFAEPADVGGNYEAFLYRNLLAIAAGVGVPYAAMTGDLRQTTYSSIRAGLVSFRRRIEAMQWKVVIYQLCRPVWHRFLDEGVIAGELPIAPAAYLTNRRKIRKVKWITPKWELIDPEKDLKAEVIAVDNGFKSRDDVIESTGFDAEETDKRIAASKARAKIIGAEFGTAPPPPAADGADEPDEDDEDAPKKPVKEEADA